MPASAFDICENAAADLDRLWDSDPKAAASVVVALDEVLADPALIEKLTTQGDAEFKTQRLGIKRWREAQRSPNNLWRFRILNNTGNQLPHRLWLSLAVPSCLCPRDCAQG